MFYNDTAINGKYVALMCAYESAAQTIFSCDGIPLIRSWREESQTGDPGDEQMAISTAEKQKIFRRNAKSFWPSRTEDIRARRLITDVRR